MTIKPLQSFLVIEQIEKKFWGQVRLLGSDVYCG